MANIKNLLSITSWNINGLESKINGIKSNKLHEQEVINCLNKSDIIGLVETHADSNTDISLQGYCVFRKDRPRHKKAWKSSGGIAVLVKDSLRKACRFDPISDSDAIWMRLQKEVTKINCDLFLAFIYLPPFNWFEQYFYFVLSETCPNNIHTMKYMSGFENKLKAYINHLLKV